MKHYYLVTYQSLINDKTCRIIAYVSRKNLILYFYHTTRKLLSFAKISKKEAKYLGWESH